MLTSFRHAVTEVLATSLDLTPAELLKHAGAPSMDASKLAMGKSLGTLLKGTTDPERLANIARLASSRGAQLVGSAPDKAKKYIAVGTAAAQRMAKGAADLTAATRAELPKKDFAVPAKKSNTGQPAYPIEDAQHARSALGFAKMHGDGSDYAAVRAKVQKKYPDLLKKQALATAAETVFLSKEAGPLLQRIGKAVASEAGTHKAELAGLGVLAVPGIDQLQAHARAALAGKYNKDEIHKRELLPEVAHPLMETAGLGILAAPSAAHLLRGKAH